MKTGEGKTLVATLPTYLNALEGKGVHVDIPLQAYFRINTPNMGQSFSAMNTPSGSSEHRPGSTMAFMN